MFCGRITSRTIRSASPVPTYEHVKADLMRSRAHMPNPAVFALTSDLALPAIETFVPLAKQLVYELVSAKGV